MASGADFLASVQRHDSLLVGSLDKQIRTLPYQRATAMDSGDWTDSTLSLSHSLYLSRILSLNSILLFSPLALREPLTTSVVVSYTQSGRCIIQSISHPPTGLNLLFDHPQPLTPYDPVTNPLIRPALAEGICSAPGSTKLLENTLRAGTWLWGAKCGFWPAFNPPHPPPLPPIFYSLRKPLVVATPKY